MGQREALDDLLGGAKGRAVSFKAIGDEVTGTVIDYDRVPETDPEGKPRLWPSGDQRFMVVLTLQTHERADEDDDGRRRVFVNKYGMKTAIADALRAANWRDNLTGGVFHLRYTGDDKPAKRGQSGMKRFEAKFTPPSRVIPFEVVAEAITSSNPTGSNALPDNGETDDIPF